MAEQTVKIPNISCGHCVKTIEREVGDLEGVQQVEADQATRMVTVRWDEEAVDWPTVESLLREIHYPPEA